MYCLYGGSNKNTIGNQLSNVQFFQMGQLSEHPIFNSSMGKLKKRKVLTHPHILTLLDFLWDSVIQMFHLSEHSSITMCLDS